MENKLGRGVPCRLPSKNGSRCALFPEFLRTRIAHSVLIAESAPSSTPNGYHAYELCHVENWVMLFANDGSNHHLQTLVKSQLSHPSQDQVLVLPMFW